MASNQHSNYSHWVKHFLKPYISNMFRVLEWMIGAKHGAVLRSFRVLRPLKVFNIIASKYLFTMVINYSLQVAES